MASVTEVRARPSKIRAYIRSLEVKQSKSGAFANDQWINPDLAPVDSARRTWGASNFAIYWATGGFAIYNYTVGSALISYGLSAQQCLAAGILSPLILAAMCVLCGWPGGSHHITYTVTSRLAWGMRGSWFAVFIRVLPGLVWDGIEAFWGGQAVSTMIGTMSLKWAHWSHPLAQGTLELKDFIGFLIYYVMFLLLMWLPPEKLHRPFLYSCGGFTLVVFGLLIWSVKNAGSGGKYFAHDYTPAATLAGSTGWAVVYGATSVVGNCAVITLGQSDWCRFSKSGNRIPMIAQVIACPVFIYLAFMMGIIITSASTNVLGESFWQPYLLLREIQNHYKDSSSSRVAVFFASAACAFAQVTVNIILNSVASAMDLASYAPRWLNIRRGSYLIAAVGVAVCPWQITSSAATFITALSGFGIFYGPCSGILVADFWLVRRRLIKMRDLYVGDASSIYWYWNGINPRAFTAFVIGVTPALPGYAMGCADVKREPNGWMKFARLGFITGFFIAFAVYWGLSTVCPPEGLGQGEDHHDENVLILPSAFDQTSPTQSRFTDSEVIELGSVSEGKGSAVDEKKRY